jgi:hypothetical protein
MPQGHLLRAMAQDQRQELLKQVSGPKRITGLSVTMPAITTYAYTLHGSQIEERKRLHARLMEKVRERSATRTTTAEVGSSFPIAGVAYQCLSTKQQAWMGRAR